MNRQEILDWLLTGDHSVRWQVKRDLLGEPKEAVLAERMKITNSGFGAELMSFQDNDGKWSGQLYNGKWVSTTYIMLLLKDLGILPDRHTVKACAQLFDSGIYKNEEIRFSRDQLLRDNGITGMVLGILCYFGYEDDRIHNIADYLQRSQQENGSWLYDNREDVEKYSFDTTLIVLKALFEYRKRFHSSHITKAELAGQVFLLKHKLYRNIGTDEQINKNWLRLAYPSYWFYNILSALDYFRAIINHDNRLQDAIDILKKKRNKNGTWRLGRKYPGKTFFDMEQTSKPSRFITLKCMRILEWWDLI